MLKLYIHFMLYFYWIELLEHYGPIIPKMSLNVYVFVA